MKHVTFSSLVLSVCALAFLNGCADPNQQEAMRSLDPKWKATADRKSLFETVSFTRGSQHLSGTYNRKIKTLRKAMKPNMPIYARLLVPEAYSEAERKLWKSRIEHIRKLLEGMGVRKHHIEISERSGLNLESSNSSEMTLILDQYLLVLPNCPGWEGVRSGSVTHGEEAFGCANAYNLGLMVSNPKDLYDADHVDKADGPFQALAIDRYRKDKKKEVKIEKAAKSDG